MKPLIEAADGLSRRGFLKGAGALIVSFGMPIPGNAAAATAIGWPEKLPADALDSWIAVRQDGSVVAAVGKIEAGMGVSTAFAQIIAEELDVAVERVFIRMGDTATTPDQRGTGSSNGIVKGGSALKTAGAEAKAALLELASRRLAVPVEQLTVQDGVVSVTGAPQRSVGYGELIGGQQFEIRMTGKAKPKPASQHRIVGQPIPRFDIPSKTMAEYPYLVNLRLPGMLHARVIRPPQANARLFGVPSAQHFPGLLKIVQKGDFLAVVCQREEQAVRAARDLKVRWSTPEPMFAASYDALYESLRNGEPKASKSEGNVGDVEAAFAAAAKIVEADYEYPFQSHASMGPGCGVADVRADSATVWMGGQKPYPLRKAAAELLGLPLEKVRVIWMAGPGSYGMNDADDAALDAAFISREMGQPVRLQYMRSDGTGWDPKSPPAVFRLRGGLDAQGQVVAYDYAARGYSARVRPSGTDKLGDSLLGQMFGGMKAHSTDLFPFIDEEYKFPNKRKTAYILPWEQSINTGLRTAHLRDPDGPQTTFANESFIDEMAAAAGADPVEFRLRYLKEEREKEVLRAAAKLADWDTRPSPKPERTGSVVTGRGIAYAPRHGTLVAVVAEVRVDMATGRFRVTRFCVAHDCGYVINPKSLVGTVEANLMHALSRAMHEEVRFEPTRVNSVDWATYPMLDMTEVPDAVDVVLVNNRPEAKSGGAGEPATRPTIAAVANALFDATGVRIRRVPFTPENLKAAFSARKKQT